MRTLIIAIMLAGLFPTSICAQSSIIGDVTGFNQIHANSGAQIDITSTTGNPNVWVNEYIIGSSRQTSNGGLNNIYSDGGGTVLIQGDAFSNTTPSGPFIDIGNNFWGSGIDPQSSSPST